MSSLGPKGEPMEFVPETLLCGAAGRESALRADAGAECVHDPNQGSTTLDLPIPLLVCAGGREKARCVGDDMSLKSIFPVVKKASADPVGEFLQKILRKTEVAKAAQKKVEKATGGVKAAMRMAVRAARKATALVRWTHDPSPPNNRIGCCRSTAHFLQTSSDASSYALRPA